MTLEEQLARDFLELCVKPNYSHGGLEVLYVNHVMIDKYLVIIFDINKKRSVLSPETQDVVLNVSKMKQIIKEKEQLKIDKDLRIQAYEGNIKARLI